MNSSMQKRKSNRVVARSSKTAARTAFQHRPSSRKRRIAARADVRASDIVASTPFREATSKAKSYVKDPARLRRLFLDAGETVGAVPHGPFGELWAYLNAMIRLIRAYYSGEYRQVSTETLLLIIGAVIYFVNPFDMIPDFIPFIGYIDDAFVVGLTLKSVKGELDAFIDWETAASV